MKLHKKNLEQLIESIALRKERRTTKERQVAQQYHLCLNRQVAYSEPLPAHADSLRGCHFNYASIGLTPSTLLRVACEWPADSTSLFSCFNLMHAIVAPRPQSWHTFGTFPV